MPTVQLAFSPAPQFVRTARLVGVAVAQRAGVADEMLEEVRLAVGEACGRAVERHRRHGVRDLVRVVMSDDGPYVVRVLDSCPGGPAGAAAVAAAAEEAEDAAAADRVAEALLAGLVDDLAVSTGPGGTEVRMIWPVRRQLSGARD